MAVDEKEPADALALEGRDDIPKDGRLGLLTRMETEGEIHLAGVLGAEGNSRKYHRMDAEGRKPLCHPAGNAGRADDIRPVGEMVVMRLGGAPGQDGPVVVVLLADLAPGGGGKIEW